MQSPPSPPQAWDWSASQPSPTIQGHSREERGPGSFLWEEETVSGITRRPAQHGRVTTSNGLTHTASGRGSLRMMASRSFFFFWRGVVSVRNLLENMLKAMNVLPP